MVNCGDMTKQGIPRWLSGRELPANAGNAGDDGLIPVWGRSPGVENGSLLQYSHLENSMDRGASPWGLKRVRHD